MTYVEHNEIDYLVGVEWAFARARPELARAVFFELFGVFELDILKSSLGSTWPELDRKARGYPRVPESHVLQSK